MNKKAIKNAVRVKSSTILVSGDKVFIDKNSIGFPDFVGFEATCVGPKEDELIDLQFVDGKIVKGEISGLILFALYTGAAPSSATVIAELG